jgi:hypothetical protein
LIFQRQTFGAFIENYASVLDWCHRLYEEMMYVVAGLYTISFSGLLSNNEQAMSKKDLQRWIANLHGHCRELGMERAGTVGASSSGVGD